MTTLERLHNQVADAPPLIAEALDEYEDVIRGCTGCCADCPPDVAGECFETLSIS